MTNKLHDYAFKASMLCMKSGRDGKPFPMMPIAGDRIDTLEKLYDKYRRQWLKYNR